MIDENALAIRAQQGDEDALNELLVSCKDLARGKANLYYIIGYDKDDMMQEAMIALFKAVKSFDASRGVQFRTFADRCIANTLNSAAKSAADKKHIVLNTAVSLDEPRSDGEQSVSLSDTLVGGPDADPEEYMIFKELESRLFDPDGSLFSSLEKKVMRMLVQGFGYTEIADALSKQPKQIDNALQRIRKKVRSIINED